MVLMAYKLLVDTFNDNTGIFHVFEMTVGDMARMLTKKNISFYLSVVLIIKSLERLGSLAKGRRKHKL